MSEPLKKKRKSKRIELDEAYLRMAEIWAKRSYATRAKVGALVVKDRRIISDGYNGMPSGFPNDEIELVGADKSLYTNPLGLHAESNALLKISNQGGTGARGATLYLTLSPCRDCAKLIIQAGIERVIFRTLYRDTSGLDVLERAKIQLSHRPRRARPRKSRDDSGGA